MQRIIPASKILLNSRLKKSLVTGCWILIFSFRFTLAQTFTPKTSYLGQWAFSPGIPHKPGNSIYLPGAYQFGDIDQLAQYNVLSNAWSTVGGLPAIKSEFGYSLAINDRIFFGGGVDQPGTFSNTVYEFIPPGTFTTMDNIPNGPASGFSFSVGDFGFVGNGMIAGFVNLNAMYRFDPAAMPTTQWSTVTTYPGSGKINCGNASLNGFGYVGMGRSNPGSTEYTDFWKYDHTAGSGGTWTPMTPFPGTARECPILAPFCDKLILMSGWNAATNAYFQEIWEFDPAIGPQGTWTLLGTHPSVWGAQSGRYGPAYASYGDSLFFGMGYGVSNVNNDWNLFTYCAPVLNEGTFSFGASLQESNQVRLNWTSVNIPSGKYFEIERSADGFIWEFTGRIDGSENSGQAHFQFTDLFPLSGVNHYRLNEFNNQVEIIFSSYAFISLDKESEMEIFAFPNPAGDFLKVMNLQGVKSFDYSIFNSQGAECLRGVLNEDELVIPVHSLHTGIYTLRISGLSGKGFKFIKE